MGPIFRRHPPRTDRPAPPRFRPSRQRGETTSNAYFPRLNRPAPRPNDASARPNDARTRPNGARRRGALSVPRTRALTQPRSGAGDLTIGMAGAPAPPARLHAAREPLRTTAGPAQSGPGPPRTTRASRPPPGPHSTTVTAGVVCIDTSAHACARRPCRLCGAWFAFAGRRTREWQSTDGPRTRRNGVMRTGCRLGIPRWQGGLDKQDSAQNHRHPHERAPLPGDGPRRPAEIGRAHV